jgi:glycosyltransferase involved in cell wall biosynthesis
MNSSKKNILSTESALGSVDGLNHGYVSGWVYITGKELETTVNLYIDDNVIASAKPDSYRADIKMIFGAKGNTGFRIPLPATINLKKKSRLKVVANPGNFELSIHEGVIKKLKEGSGFLYEPDAKIHLLANERENVKNALKSNPDALRALNQNSEIRMLVDPGLGDIHIINGCENTSSEHFRTWPLVQSLNQLGYNPLVYSRQAVRYLRQPNLKCCIYIRCAADQELEEHIDYHRTRGTKIICDFDDFVFDPTIISKIDGVRHLPDNDRRQYIAGMRLYRKMLELSDLALLSTDPLQRFASGLAKRTHVLKNFPLQNAIQAAKEILEHNNPENANFRIGYFSGTLTHQRDFMQCVDGLTAYLRETPGAKLVLVGHLDANEFPELVSLESQIEHIPFLPYDQMIETISTCSVVLAPLEIGNEFCEAKSELKFFDAALVKVPTIASKTEVFEKCIQHGKTGFLAESAIDWYSALKVLGMSRKFVNEIGQRANEYVLSEYSFKNMVSTMADALDKIEIRKKEIHKKIVNPLDIVTPAKQNNTSVKSASIVMPDIFPGSGGHRKLLLIANELANQGIKTELVVITNRLASEIRETIRGFGFEAKKISVRNFGDVFPEADLLVASSWNTVQVVEESDAENKAYFVQDFEPYFNPMSAEYLQAYNSYTRGLKTVCLGRWIAEKLRREFDIRPMITDFPIDKHVYFPRREWKSRENIILFYARPDQPRRLYNLGREVIQNLRSILSNWRIVMYGANIIEGIEGIESLGKISDLDELAELYSRVKIGISFSSTNPSLVGLEMLATGLPVIDIKTAVGSPDYGICTGIEFVSPSIDDLTSAIYQLTIDNTELEERSSIAAEWAKTLPTDEDFAKLAVSHLLSQRK